jgi:AcrR family transcriptional regulator
MASPATADRLSQTREAILQAATEVFAREGYYEADVQVIADQAGVGKGTIYRHFKDKQKLFLAAAAHALDHVARSVDDERGRGVAREGRGVTDSLREIAVGCTRYYSAHPEAVELIVQERAIFRESITPTHLLRRSDGQEEVEDVLRQGVNSGELRPLDVHATYEAFGDLLFGSVINGVLAGDTKSLVKRVGHAVELFLRAIARSA